MQVRLAVRIGSDLWAAIATMLLVGTVAMGAMERARRESALIRENLHPSVEVTSDMLLALEQMENTEFRYFSRAVRTARDARHFDVEASRFEAGLVAVLPLAQSAIERELLSQLEQSYRRFILTEGRLRELLRAGRWHEAHELNLATSLDEATRLRALVRRFRAYNLAEILRAEERAARHLVQSEVGLAVVGLGGLLCGVMLWRRSTRLTVEPLRALQLATRAIREGRGGAAAHPEAGKTAEIEALYHDFNLMAERLAVSTAELKAANLGLEDRVAARTRELEEASQSLASMLEELRSVDRLKSNLLAVMSHELLTPINVISGFGSALEDGLMGPLTAGQVEGVRQIMDGTHRLTRMIRNVLDFTQLQSGQLPVRDEVVGDYPALVRDVAEIFRPRIESKHLHLGVVIEGEVPPVHADPERVAQILAELLDNALKFTGEGGRLELRITAQAEMVCTVITDSGIGIAPEVLPQLGKPFYQADLSSTRAYGGLGLGLAIAHHLVQRLGGQLWIESRLGEGTTARFTLRRAAPEG